MLLSKRFVFLLLIGALLMGAGCIWPAATVAGLALDALLVALLLTDLRMSASPGQIEIRRTLPDPLSVGAPCQVATHVTSNAGHVLHIQVRDCLPATFIPQPEVLDAAVPPYGHVRLQWRLTPRRRGEHRVGDLAVRYRTRLGLAVRQFRVPAEQTVRVYPDVANVNAFALLARHNRLYEVGLTQLRRAGEGTQFESLREYHRGDGLRRIEWKATAKRGKPISKNYEVERSQNLLLLLDTGRLMTAEFRGMSRLDYVLNASLMLSYVALKHGDFVGVLAFSDRIEAFLPLARGPGAAQRVLEALHSLEPRLCESDYAGAFRFLAARSRKRALILLFTDVLDETASESVLSHMVHMARRHRPLCVTLRNPEITDLARSLPDSPRAAYAKVVAMELVRGRQDALHIMRRRGVDTLDVPPDRLTVAAVNKYLEIKRRLML